MARQSLRHLFNFLFFFFSKTKTPVDSGVFVCLVSYCFSYSFFCSVLISGLCQMSYYFKINKSIIHSIEMYDIDTVSLIPSTSEDIKRISNWIIPRAASATRALLRLTPCYQVYRRSALGEISGTPGFLELTGGEYKTWERIHRGIADPRLLVIPASRSRVADFDPNWRRFSNDLLHLAVLRRVVTAIVLCV